MGKRKRNPVNPFRKEKPKSVKKGNPIYSVVGGGLKAKATKKEVNLHNRTLVEQLDQQLGEQQQQLALQKSQPQEKSAAKEEPKPAAAAAAEEKTVDEHVEDISQALMLT